MVGARMNNARNFIDFFPKMPCAACMQFSTILLTNLQAAIAVVAACPQAGRILRSLGWMLGAGKAAGRVRRVSTAWVVREAVPVVAPAGLIAGRDGRLIWV